jgi:hypothetical protein
MRLTARLVESGTGYNGAIKFFNPNPRRVFIIIIKYPMNRTQITPLFLYFYTSYILIDSPFNKIIIRVFDVEPLGNDTSR